MVIVEFTRGEVEIALEIATRRSKSNRMEGVPDQKVGDADGGVLDFVGVLGEMAFAKCRNVWMDFSCKPRSSKLGTDRFDFICGPFKNTVDVKSTRHAYGHLVVKKPDEAEKADYYVLVIVENNDTRCRIQGWLPADEVFLDKYRRADGSWWIPQGDLRDFK